MPSGAGPRTGRGPQLRYGTPEARWVLAAAILGSGIAFLDSTVVNVALPAISRDLHASVSGLQWTIDGYLVTLSALLLLGGSFGDVHGRRRAFVAGLGVFTVASVGCGAAPSVGWLIAARMVQGIGGALLVPGSMAMIGALFHPDDRARALGAWSGLAGVASAIGPFLGGYLIGAISWRLIFLINVPLAAVAAAVAVRHVPETSAPEHQPLDVTGAVAITLALAAGSYAAIEHTGAASALAAVAAVVGAVVFLDIERRSTHPMLPLRIFSSTQFSGANLTTFVVYAALGVAMFLVVLRLQVTLGYSAIEAGAALVPFTGVMFVLSPRAGQLSQRIGARIPMTVGPFVTAVGMLLFSGIDAGTRYASGVLPAVLVFAVGMALTVVPLTAAVLAGASDDYVGVASGVNNAVARLAGLLAVAALPPIAGFHSGSSLSAGLEAGYANALRIAAVLCGLGGVVSFAFIRRTAPARPVPHPNPYTACQHEGVALPR